MADAEQLSQEPALRAELFQNLGQMYLDIGRPLKAVPLYSRAILILDRQAHSPVGSMVDARLKLAGILGEGDSQAERERLIFEASHILDQRAPRDLVLRAKVNAARSGLLSSQGNSREAEHWLKSAIETLEASGSQSDFADALVSLSNLELQLGHYDESDLASRKLISIYRAMYGGNDPAVGDALENLGECEEVRGRYGEAGRDERQALKIVADWYGRDHRVTANKMSALALTLVDERKLSEADSLLGEALAIEQKAYPSNSLLISKTLKNMGMLKMAQGDYAAALMIFDRVLAIYRAHASDDTYLSARLGLYQGMAHLHRNELAQAEALLRRSIQILINVRGENDVYAALARLQLGHALLLEKRYREAEQELRTGSRTLKSLSMQQTDFMLSAERDLASIEDAFHTAKEKELPATMNTAADRVPPGLMRQN
jgi:serine/threonine-protein kinase